MGAFTTLMARDGHEFNAWLSPAAAGARGAVVLCQEIFGVNHHIRGVADSFAAAGYLTIAPCLYDRVRRGIGCNRQARPVALRLSAGAAARIG